MVGLTHTHTHSLSVGDRPASRLASERSIKPQINRSIGRSPQAGLGMYKHNNFHQRTLIKNGSLYGRRPTWCNQYPSVSHVDRSGSERIGAALPSPANPKEARRGVADWMRERERRTVNLFINLSICIYRNVSAHSNCSPLFAWVDLSLSCLLNDSGACMGAIGRMKSRRVTSEAPPLYALNQSTKII